MTQTKAPAQKPAETKQADTQTKAPAQKPAEKLVELPVGHEACFVAVPNKVHGPEGRVGPGARITCPSKVIDELELRGLAFREENEAKAAFTTFKRRKQAELEKRAEELRKKEERRQRWKEELQKGESLEWGA